MDRAIKFIKNHTERGVAVKLKADGSVPATLRDAYVDDAKIADYLRQELRMSNFTDVLKRKGYASIYLTNEHADQVLHIRVMQGSSDFHYVD